MNKPTQKLPENLPELNDVPAAQTRRLTRSQIIGFIIVPVLAGVALILYLAATGPAPSAQTPAVPVVAPAGAAE